MDTTSLFLFLSYNVHFIIVIFYIYIQYQSILSGTDILFHFRMVLALSLIFYPLWSRKQVQRCFSTTHGQSRALFKEMYHILQAMRYPWSVCLQFRLLILTSVATFGLGNWTNLKYSYLELLESNEGHRDQSFRQNNSLFLRTHSCLFPGNHNLSYFEEGFRDICGLLRNKIQLRTVHHWVQVQSWLITWEYVIYIYIFFLSFSTTPTTPQKYFLFYYPLRKTAV